MPHSTNDFQPYELIFCYKAPTIWDAWLGFTNYSDKYSQSKHARVNQQHDLILSIYNYILTWLKDYHASKNLRGTWYYFGITSKVI